MLQRFYNDRRKHLGEVEPNAAHRILADLEKNFDVTVVTQNVDNFHECAGSAKILHLHGELTKARSSDDPYLIVDIGYRPIEPGEKAPDGSPLRPHVVWFGEIVDMIEPAIKIVSEADILVVIGTSLNVYPAAGLIKYARKSIPVFQIDPDEINHAERDMIIIQQKATLGMEMLKEALMNMLAAEPSEPKQMSLTVKNTNEIAFKIAGSGTMTIDWGDETPHETNMLSSPDPASAENYIHSYPDTSFRTITINGDNISCLACDSPQLTSLDVSGNTALKSLICINSQITNLDVSNNTALNNLICAGNQLTNLDVSANLVLERLNCSGNQLPGL